MEQLPKKQNPGELLSKRLAGEPLSPEEQEILDDMGKKGDKAIASDNEGKLKITPAMLRDAQRRENFHLPRTRESD